MAGKRSQNYSIMNQFKGLLVLLILFQEAYSQQSQNLLINGDFNMSDLNGARYALFPRHIPGWNCTNYCQVDSCPGIDYYFQQLGWPLPQWDGFVLDLVSDRHQNITQDVILEYGYYTLSFKYYYPRPCHNPMALQVYFNEVKIFNFTQNISYYSYPVYFEKRIQGVTGVNTLRFTTKIITVFDTSTFFIGNVKLTKTADSLMSLVNNTFLNDVGVVMAKIPGSRVILTDFMSFFVNLDRLQLYYFHNRNYSQYSNVLLADINILNDLKGLFFRNVLEHIVPTLGDKIDSFFSSIDYKYDYSASIILERDDGGRGFFSNCYSFFAYNIPGTLITYLVFLGLFKLVKNRPASRIIRKFSFFGLFIPMVFEGNIEWLTYYSIGEMTLFFSASLQHRLINVFIVFFQLIVTMISVGSVLLFKYHYRRLIFYFIEDKRNNGLGVLCQTVDNGIICMLFGIAHQVLFARPQLQLFVLLFLECAWMVFKACLVFRKAYRKQFSQFIMLNSGFLRMCFIVTFYFYGFAGELRTLINDAYHKGLIIVMILLWLQELLVSLLQLVISIPQFFARLRLLNKKGKSTRFIKKERFHEDNSIKKAQYIIVQKIVEANIKYTCPSLFKVHRNNSIVKSGRKGRVFEHSKVRIAHLRANAMLKV